MKLTCVLRNTAGSPGTPVMRYVPAKDVPLQDGEKLFTGEFVCHGGFKVGPYKTDVRTVCTPISDLIESVHGATCA